MAGDRTDGPSAPCAGLIGLTDDELVRRCGLPVARRTVAGDTWLVFRSAGVSLRARCEGSAPARVVSWTATFEAGHVTLRAAARAVGLWPAAAPDQEAATVQAPLIRRPLPCPRSGRLHSLTASVRHGRITRISVFDEPPEWT